MSEPTRKQLLWGGGILAGAILIAVLLVTMRGEPPQEAAEDQAPLVETAPVEVRAGVLEVRATGTVTPLAEIDLTPQVSGQVVYVNPALVSGGRVEEGELLVRVDPADFRNRVRQAQADVAQQRVAVLEAEQEVELARREYRAFQRREARRQAGAFPSIDQDDYAARIMPPGAAAGGDSTGAGADGAAVTPGSVGGVGDPDPEAESSLVFREPQLDAARAALERAQAGLEDARLALSRTEVRAPFPALVRSESVDIGSYVSPGQTLAQLVAAEGVEVVAPLTRAEAALIPELWDTDRVDPIEAVVYADYGGYRYGWDGRVHRAEAVLDPETRTIDVVIRVPRPVGGGYLVADPDAALDAGEFTPVASPPLLVGDFVTASVDGARLDRYVTFPARALRRGDSVWVVRDGRLTRVRVQVLRREDGRIAGLASGIEAGDRVVVDDIGVATEGMEVRTQAEARTVPRTRADTGRPGSASGSGGADGGGPS